MVASQVALSVLLLVCSVLVVRSLQRALHAPIGYNPEGAATVSFDLNLQGYNEPRGRAFERRLLEKVRSLPGIESAALIDWLPLSLNSSSDSIYIEGQPKPKAADAPIAYTFSVSPEYFRTMQTRLLEGREFDARDKEGGKRVAVVNKAFVQQLLHGEEPLADGFMTSPDGNADRDRGCGGGWQVLFAVRRAEARLLGSARDLVQLECLAGGAHEVERRAGGPPVEGRGARSRPDHCAVCHRNPDRNNSICRFSRPAWRHRRWALLVCWR